VSTATVADDVLEVRSSRLWALCTFRFTAFLIPPRMRADSHGISTIKVGFWLTPWVREEEHLPISHVAEFKNERGLIWDSISVESSGGLNPLTIEGVAKSRASDFIQRVRGLMGPKT
jgi:hypothetical protein